MQKDDEFVQKLNEGDALSWLSFKAIISGFLETRQ